MTLKNESIDLIEIYAYGTSKDLVSGKEQIKYNNIMEKSGKYTLKTF